MKKIKSAPASSNDKQESKTARLATSDAAIASSRRAAFLWAMSGGVMLWAAFPPLNFGWLGWLATIPWIALTLRCEALTRGSYTMLWIAGWIHWAALLQGVRLAHPALYPGWLVLSAYLGVYLPLFVGGSRCLLARGVPAIIALPMVWTAWEYARAYFVTGFSTASLSHTQVEYPLLLQIADLGGAYTLSFLMLTVTTAMVLWWPSWQLSTVVRLSSSIYAALLLTLSLTYGNYKLTELSANSASMKPSARILLVQGCVDTVLDDNPERPRIMLDHYRGLTFEHLAKNAPYDLIVWPETAFAYPDFMVDPAAQPSAESGLSRADFQSRAAAQSAEFSEILQYFSSRFNAPQAGRTSFLTGITTVKFGENNTQTYNTALLISPDGKPVTRYFKNHLVMFGEYIPIAEWFPWIYRFTPLPGGLSRGDGPHAFKLNQLTFAPNICFESTVPHLIRRQVNTLAERNEEPDVLLNSTNDGWFYGSAILDLHFQCAVMRAVENRKPFLIAANTGISGVIDGNGRILQRGPNHATALLTAEVQADGRRSPYRAIGDWPAFICFAITFGTMLFTWRKRST